jgi:site-specific recombinase XerD
MKIDSKDEIAGCPTLANFHKLSALSSVFDYLCERNAVDGVKRPMANGNESSTPGLGDAQARRLIEATALDALKGVRDRGILGTLLYHGIWREQLCLLRLRDMQRRQGVTHCRIKGKRAPRAAPRHKLAPLLTYLVRRRGFILARTVGGAPLLCCDSDSTPGPRRLSGLVSAFCE